MASQVPKQGYETLKKGLGMRFSDLRGAACPLARSMVEVGDWWSLLVIREVFLGACRFTDMQRNLGVARNILSARLKKLVENGVLTLEPGPAGAQSYQLTEKGKDLKDVLLAFVGWGERWLPADPAAIAANAPASPRGRGRAQVSVAVET